MIDLGSQPGGHRAGLWALKRLMLYTSLLPSTGEEAVPVASSGSGRQSRAGLGLPFGL